MEERKQIRIALTDDHRVLRQGLRMLLEQEAAFEVVGEASNGRELLRMLPGIPADVVLMDIHMPELDGFETTQELRRSFPETKVIALSVHNNPACVQRMLACGASGYLLKNASREEVSAAIKLVAGGGQFISSEISARLLEQPVNPEAAGKGLSRREVEVLTLVSEGYTNAEIAEKLFTSKRTIETHRQNMLEKTQTKNTAHLVRYAIEHGIIRIKGAP